MNPSENDRLHDDHARLLALAERANAASRTGPALDQSLARSPEPALGLGLDFGPYHLDAVLGHGGQGVVYRAIDARLGRPVALKLLSARGAALPGTRARFEREAIAVSRLRHPGLCTVYEAGEVDGQRFLAMELIEGESLADWIAARRAACATETGGRSALRRAWTTRVLEIVEQAARAVEAAHAVGVVHRDLKPANVMLRADGSAVVLDFGLAWNEDSGDAGLTAPGDVLGTPAYMPPERVLGVRRIADPREDVYGLGAVLYEALAGEPPFEGNTREELYRRILATEPADPRRANPAVPPEARFVVQTALDKDPDRRYASAAAFADDVGRLRRREPIRARPVPWRRRVLRWVRRDPRVAWPTLAAFAILLLGIGVALSLLWRVDAEARQARIRALIAASSNELSDDPQCALLLARAAARQLRPSDPDELQVDVRSQLLEVLARTRPSASFEQGEYPKAIGFSADGRRVVSVTRGDSDVTLQVHDADDLSLVAEFDTPGEGNERLVTSAVLDAERGRALLGTFSGTTYVVATSDARVVHELVPSGKGKLEYDHDGGLKSKTGTLVGFVPGRPERCVTGSRDGLRLFEVRDGKRRGVERWCDARPDWESTRGVCQIAISPDGRLAAGGEHDGTLRVLRIDDGRLVGQSKLHAGAVHALAFDPSRSLLFSASSLEAGIRVWHTDDPPTSSAAGEPELRAAGQLDLDGYRGQEFAWAPSREGAPGLLAIADDNRGVWLCRSVQRPPFLERVRWLSAADGDAFGICFSDDGARLAVGSNTSSLRLFDRDGNAQEELRGVSNVVQVAWSHDGERIATQHLSGVATVWRTNDEHMPVRHVPRAVNRIAAAGDHVVAALRDGSVVVIDERDGAQRRVEGVVRGAAVSFALRGDGERLAVGGSIGRALDVWDLSGPEPQRVTPPDEVGSRNLRGDALAYRRDGALILGGAERCLAMHPDGRLEPLPFAPWPVALAAIEDTVCVVRGDRGLWDATRDERDETGVLRAHGVVRAIPSADGRWLAILVQSRELRIVDCRTRRVRHVISAAGLREVALSADGGLLLVGGMSGRASLLDLTGDVPRKVVDYRGHREIVWGVCFSPDGRQAITAGSDGVIRYWPLDLDGVEHWAEERSTRDWNDDERVRFGDLITR